ncbi:MAG: DUF1549 domain-containing protein, partial [Planctomycetaceae bacterium]
MAAVIVSASPVLADTPRVDYVRDVKPLLARRCGSCHGPLRQRGNLRLDAAVLILKGGDTGPAVVAGKPEESLLIDAVGKAEYSSPMPAEGEPLTAEEVALLRAWIAQGAVAPPDEEIAAGPRTHWAFRPVEPGRAAPVRADTARLRACNPIDAFLAAEYERLGLTPLPEASQRVLLRRVSLDLIGLPPTPEEIDAFLADDRPDAYERVVDRLLANPHYGERWGRHWMDVWRYSDWYGYKKELRNSGRHIWRWRDWIVESLNADKPYDRMIVEMLAGDEIAPADPDVLRATGFLVRNYYKFNRHVWMDDTVEHTGKAFLGLTLNCARCHNHMYDPLSQEEYYRFRAFFEPYQVRTDRVPGESNIEADGLTRAYDADLEAQTFLFVRGNDKEPDKDHPLTAAVPAMVADEPLLIEPIELPAEAYYPGLRPHVQREALADAEAELTKRQAELDRVKAKSESTADAAKELEIAEKHLAAATAERDAIAARIAADNARHGRTAEADAMAM